MPQKYPIQCCQVGSTGARFQKSGSMGNRLAPKFFFWLQAQIWLQFGSMTGFYWVNDPFNRGCSNRDENFPSIEGFPSFTTFLIIMPAQSLPMKISISVDISNGRYFWVYPQLHVQLGWVVRSSVDFQSKSNISIIDSITRANQLLKDVGLIAFQSCLST